MAVCILAHNGVGLGHLTRSIEIGTHFAENNIRPFLFCPNPNLISRNLPFTLVRTKSIKNPFDPYRPRVEDQINSAGNIGPYKLFIEDTHPMAVQLSPKIKKILVVRPTTFEYLEEIKQNYSFYYDAFFIADHFESPTWPYTVAETEDIKCWENWKITGPIFRSPQPTQIQMIKNKYSWREKIPFFVFSMGGGGQHLDSNDINTFIDQALKIASDIKRRCIESRFIFVKGPLFDQTIEIPHEFEEVDLEDNMPELFSICKAAIIRPGFNSVWECIAGGTPFVCIQGTTKCEPISEKLHKLIESGIIPENNSIADIFKTKIWEENISKVKSRWDGKPGKEFLEAIEKKEEMELVLNDPAEPRTFHRFSKAFKDLNIDGIGKSFFFRVDDVIELSPEMVFILSLCSKQDVFLSLEIIPYLSIIEEIDLLEYDPSFKNVIVSQHGFNHAINLINPDSVRSEFTFLEPTKTELENIAIGKAILTKTFPQRFKNGFSAPFDMIPDWFDQYWRSLRGEYISVINQRIRFKSVPKIQVPIDLWDWKENRMITLELLCKKMETEVKRRDNIGIVLHPKHFANRENRAYIFDLIEGLKERGFNKHYNKY
jgi:hypothetical protein